MKNREYSKYYLLSCFGVLLASYYPLSMGIRVIADMIANGTVMKENYPKYIIPYTPISVAIIIGVLLMPLFIKFLKKFALAGGAVVSTGVFFTSELLFEQKVVVSTAETVTKLEDWQMYMCYVPPEGWGETVTTYKTQTAVDILMGDYNPAFKLHFYVISIVLILTVLNCLYGFGQMIKNGDKKRCKSLILQSVCSAVFLGLCILACFTAFWRDGSIQVSVLSASLMTLFFVVFGITAGALVGSFLLGKRKILSVLVPAVTASAMTLLMYIGEMVLLNGHLYSLGNGVLFDGLPGIVFAPIDVLVILFSGYITALVFTILNKDHTANGTILTACTTGIRLADVGRECSLSKTSVRNTLLEKVLLSNRMRIPMLLKATDGSVVLAKRISSGMSCESGLITVLQTDITSLRSCSRPASRMRAFTVPLLKKVSQTGVSLSTLRI